MDGQKLYHEVLRDQHANRQHQNGDKRAAHMQQEDHADQCDNRAFFNQGPLQRADGADD